MKKWNMQKIIIGFEFIESEKNGNLLKNALMTVFTNFGIQNKILSLRFDNASSNAKCIDYIFESRCLDFLLKIFSMFDAYVMYSTCVFKMVLKHYLT